jgi:hypothetical protein
MLVFGWGLEGFQDLRVKTYAKVLEEVLGLVVDIQLASLGEVKSRDLRNELILALTLLLLKLEGDTADGSTLNTLHQVGGVAGNLFWSMLAIDGLSFLRRPFHSLFQNIE